jgi:hypothetical protein
MLPSCVGTAFEVVEPELALQVFVGPLDTPALLDTSVRACRGLWSGRRDLFTAVQSPARWTEYRRGYEPGQKQVRPASAGFILTRAGDGI